MNEWRLNYVRNVFQSLLWFSVASCQSRKKDENVFVFCFWVVCRAPPERCCLWPATQHTAHFINLWLLFKTRWNNNRKFNNYFIGIVGMLNWIQYSNSAWLHCLLHCLLQCYFGSYIATFVTRVAILVATVANLVTTAATLIATMLLWLLELLLFLLQCYIGYFRPHLVTTVATFLATLLLWLLLWLLKCYFGYYSCYFGCYNCYFGWYSCYFVYYSCYLACYRATLVSTVSSCKFKWK